ncbi:uncharacterized protein LOC129883662 [Solanum dulcamara]|uniref:uncharacterized protein LOC129883662 n=1 Tax=Solanum dulcamara TaxID=45834 RepID=UPI002485BCC3|nr:uncharacterized protein LOC129883662 [Solanum dulcamara]
MEALLHNVSSLKGTGMYWDDGEYDKSSMNSTPLNLCSSMLHMDALYHSHGLSQIAITARKEHQAVVEVAVILRLWGNQADGAHGIQLVMMSFNSNGKHTDANGAPRAFSWYSKKQDIVAQSTVEAEFIAATAAVNQALWLRKIMCRLNMEQTEGTEVFIDDQAAISTANNPVFHAKTKHFNIKLFFLRDVQKDGDVKLLY